MRRLLTSLLAVMLLALPVSAQYRCASDSSGLANDVPAFRPVQLIAPAALVGSGVAIHFLAHDSWDAAVNERFSAWRGNSPGTKVDDWMQYVPYVMDLGLAFAGVPAENAFVDRLVESTLSFAAVAAVTRVTKLLVASPRPVGDLRSFPSGHTGTAFTAAELVRMEYGWGWGAGAYAIATAVGVLRMYNGAHWFSDVLTGAGLGILSAHVGRWLLEPAKNLFGIPDTDWGSGRRKDGPALSAGLSSSVDPYSGALCMGVALRF